LTLDLQK